MNKVTRFLSAGTAACAVLIAVCSCAGTPVSGTPVPAANTDSVSDQEVRVFDASTLAQGVRKVLESSYGATDVDQVRCPEGEEVRKGHRFDCTVLIGGKSYTVTLTVRDEAGEYEVSTPR
jgi:hypothetical protein